MQNCELYISILKPKMQELQLVNLISDLHSLIDGVHFDVMDGKFVPVNTLNWQTPSLLRKLKNSFPHLKYSVHLMALKPETYIRSYISAGAQEIFFHCETQTLNETAWTVYKIKKRAAKAGIAINPNTSLDSFIRVADIIDSVLIMSVQPGKGGQKFILKTAEKLKLIAQCFPRVELAVDGGIDEKHAQLCKAIGAKKLVVGSAILNQKNPFEAAYKMKKILRQVI